MLQSSTSEVGSGLGAGASGIVVAVGAGAGGADVGAGVAVVAGVAVGVAVAVAVGAGAGCVVGSGAAVGYGDAGGVGAAIGAGDTSSFVPVAASDGVSSDSTTGASLSTPRTERPPHAARLATARPSARAPQTNQKPCLRPSGTTVFTLRISSRIPLRTISIFGTRLFCISE